VEVFTDDGAVVITEQVFPKPESQGVSRFSDGGTARLQSLDAWGLRK
jgi:sucrose-6-phosphate hydrolase SacC (GH32 family)